MKHYPIVFTCFLGLMLSGSPVYAQGIFEGTADWDRGNGDKVEGGVEVTGEGADAIYSLMGDGADIWETTDEGFFVFTEQTGAWAIQGQFTWVEPGGNEWSKFGPMVREDAEDAQSINFYMAIRGNLGTNDLTSPQWRPTAGAASASYGPRVRNDNYEQVTMNDDQQIWMRASYVPSINQVIGEYSFDGENWEVAYSRTLEMSDTVAYGFAITDHDANDFLAVGEVTGAELINLDGTPWVDRNLPVFTGGGKSVQVTLDVLTPASFTLTDNAPEGWEITDVSNGGSIDGNTVTWELDDSVTQVSYTVLVPDEVASGDDTGFDGTSDTNNIIGDQVVQVWNPSPIAGFDGWIETGDANMGEINDRGEGVTELVSDGDDIEGTDDDMLFLFNEFSGNFSVTGSFELFGASGEDWSKAGIMVRDNLGVDSANAFAMQNSSGAVRWQQRSTNGGGTGNQGSTISPDELSNGGFPATMQIIRINDQVAYFYEDTNGDWVNIGLQQIPDLQDPVYVGFALTSNANDNPAVAEVSNFDITQIPYSYSRNLPEQFTLGESMQVQVTVEIEEGESASLTLNEIVPDGFTVSDVSASDGDASESGGTITWTLSDASGTLTLSYNVTSESTHTGEWSSSVESSGLALPPIGGNDYSVNANAIEYVFQEGLNGYAGTQDTFFLTGDAGRLVGEETEWEWDGSDAGGFNVGVLQFQDIVGDGPGQVPSDSEVVSAVITLNVTNEGSADATVHELLKPFDESSDFIDFTLNIEPVEDDDYSAEVVATLPGLSVGDVLNIDVTSSVQKWVGGEATNYGWMFRPGGTNGVGIASSEAASGQPMLTILVAGDGTGVYNYMLH